MELDKRPKKVCYVLSYRAPQYIRTLSLTKALEQISSITVYRAINRSTGMFRYLDTFLKLLYVRLRHNPDCYLLGFRGHEIFWMVKVITWGKPIIFDSLVSPYSVLKNENKLRSVGSLSKRLIFSSEQAILNRADTILTDTGLHADHIAHTFSIRKTKIVALPVGAIEVLPQAHPTSNNRPLEVLFYGSFLPLHGMRFMLEAAAIVQDRPIHFTFIGGKGSSLAAFQKTVHKLGLRNISHKKWVLFNDLLNVYIPNSDICLGGPFGDTPQARRVITGKTSQALACGKATIVGEIMEPVPFSDKENCLLIKQGDSSSLANALTWATNNRDKLPAIGRNGMKLYHQHLSIACARKILKDVIHQC